MRYFWDYVGFKNSFRVYSCSWTTFIFYVNFNSDIWFWLNFGVIFDIFGPSWAIFWVGVGLKNCFGVYSCSWPTFIFYSSFNSDFWFWLYFGYFLVRVGLTNYFVVSSYRIITFFSKFCFISALSCSFEFVWVWDYAHLIIHKLMLYVNPSRYFWRKSLQKLDLDDSRIIFTRSG